MKLFEVCAYLLSHLEFDLFTNLSNLIFSTKICSKNKLCIEHFCLIGDIPGHSLKKTIHLKDAETCSNMAMPWGYHLTTQQLQ